MDAILQAYATPRIWKDYQVGQTVYYTGRRAWRERPAFWHGPAKVIQVSLPNSVWISHHGKVIKAAPEHLRPASDDKKYTLTDWIEAIRDIKKDLAEDRNRSTSP